MSLFVCNDCIEISQRDPQRTLDGKRLPHEIQCPACGAWWRQSSPKTIHFLRYRDGEWYRFSWGHFHYWCYTPIECQHRRCQDQAVHKTTGKRKWKCERHAGVCLIA